MNLDQVRYVDDAIASRHSVRAFLPKAVDPQIIKDISGNDRMLKSSIS